MKSFIFAIASVLFIVALSANCKKGNACYWDAEPRAPLFFQIYKNGGLVIDSSFLSSVQLYYFHDNQKIFLTQFGLLTNADSNIFYKNGVVYADLLSTLDVKEYFLKYPDSSWATDTLLIDYLPPSSATGCQYKLNAVKYNHSVPGSTIIFYQPVYIFNKP